MKLEINQENMTKNPNFPTDCFLNFGYKEDIIEPRIR